MPPSQLQTVAEAPARRGLGLALSAPSGSGKTTLAKRLVETDPGADLSISVTTRSPRPNEEHGRDYFFIDMEEFIEMRDHGQLLEHAEIFGNHYATTREFVEKRLAAGRDVIFDVDWQGVQQLREQLGVDLISVFIMPPSLTELHHRLTERGQDSTAVVAKRMDLALSEIRHWEEADYIILNDDLEVAFGQLTNILSVARMARVRQLWLREFTNRLHAESEKL